MDSPGTAPTGSGTTGWDVAGAARIATDSESAGITGSTAASYSLPLPAPVENPTRRQIHRWQKYVANERAEAAVYRELAKRRTGEEREILLEIAEAERRHEEYWLAMLGNNVGMPRKAGLSTRLLALLARSFGSVFVLALIQSAETRSPYLKDADATSQMNADEAIHAEVIRGLAARGRERLSGSFRAAVFGANDGLVSNLALVLGVIGSGMSHGGVMVTGFSGLLAGALSMAAGEYASVSSQRTLLAASSPNPEADRAVPYLDIHANELALVYRARGLPAEEANIKAARVLAQFASSGERAAGASDGPAPDRSVDFAPQASDELAPKGSGDTVVTAAHGEKPSIKGEDTDAHVAVGSAIGAASSSFLCFASGAIIPLLPFIFGIQGLAAVISSCVVVSLALLFTGSLVGLLSGTSVLRRAVFQWILGAGAAAVTFGLGTLAGGVIG